MPSTRPRIKFVQGVCNACLYARKSKDLRIDYAARLDKLKALASKIRSERSSQGVYDCIIPWSGGKDSSTIAFKLRDEYGLNPLLLHFNPLVPTLIGEHNRRVVLEAGFDSIEIKPDREASRQLSIRFLTERGNPKLHWDAGINAAIFQAAIALNIKYIFYAEHGETHYGGRVLSDQAEQIRDYEEVIENQIGDDPSNWTDGSYLSRLKLAPYIMPESHVLNKSAIEAHYFGYYTKWNVMDNYRYISSRVDFATHPAGRSCGTITDFDSLDDYMDDLYYYMQFIKFGFGRAIRDLSRQIQKGEIERSEAVCLAKKYDGEYPVAALPQVLAFLRISEGELQMIIEKHRSNLVWYFNDSNLVNRVHELLFGC